MILTLIKCAFSNLLCILILYPFSTGLLYAEDNVVVSGRNFEVCEGYLEAMREFYQTAQFSSTTEEYVKMASKIKVFAQEANMLGLEPVEIGFLEQQEIEQPSRHMQDFIRDLGLSESYMVDVLANYGMDDIVIESYYRSHPEKFREEGSMAPLDEELKNEIRQGILNTVKKQIMQEQYQELKDKYAVQIKE